MNQAHKLQVKQFKHDIQSPIAALRTILKSNSVLKNNEYEIVGLSIERINDLIDSLQVSEESYSKSNIFKIITEIVDEKKTIHAKSNYKFKICFEREAKEAICNVQKTELKRLLSNILNNSLDAINEDGFIKIKCSIKEKTLNLSIIDNGHGISKEYINHITDLGWSHRKASGQGLGLFHAKKTIEKWNGNLKINSVFNLGTKVHLTLPIERNRLSFAA
jgi:signal transduction histidine kinase